jgi:hypothetical protein
MNDNTKETTFTIVVILLMAIILSVGLYTLLPSKEESQCKQYMYWKYYKTDNGVKKEMSVIMMFPEPLIGDSIQVIELRHPTVSELKEFLK